MGWGWTLIWVWLRRRGGGRLLTFSTFRMGAYWRLGPYSNKYGNTPHHNGFNDNTYQNGYWPSAKSRRLHTGQVLFCVFMDRHEVEVHVDRISLANKRFIKENFSCGTNGGNPERAKLADLTRSGSQSENRIRFILPACGFGHMISAIVLQVARKGS